MVRFSSVRKIALGFVACLTTLSSLASEQEATLDYRLNEHVVQIPAGKNGKAMMETTVFQPDGPGPFPLLILNHGKEAGPPSEQPRDRFIFAATAFVKRGYAVMVPMRQGFAHSTGRYKDFGCNMTANGFAQADDVQAALDYARTQPWIDAERIVVAGQSYGGLATVALGTRDLKGVRGLINFAGGLRDEANGCDWRTELVRAFRTYGANNKVASLWMYGDNDSLFGPKLVARMHHAFVRSGGDARLIAYAPFKRDAHGMISSQDGEKVWWAGTERFLKEINMPTEVRYQVSARPSLPSSNFAKLEDVNAVPYMSELGRRGYREYLSKMTPRAFALSPNGDWCWAEEGENPGARALATCEEKAGQPCRLYSVDEKVVWRDANDPAQHQQQRAATIASSVGNDTRADAASAVGSSAAENSAAK